MTNLKCSVFSPKTKEEFQSLEDYRVNLIKYKERLTRNWEEELKMISKEQEKYMRKKSFTLINGGLT